MCCQVKPVDCMKTIKINFANYWDGARHDYANDPVYKFLCSRYNVEISQEPDYLFCEVHGHDDLRFDCVKIVASGENMVPDFSRFDYVMGFDYIEFSDRYLRFPLYAQYDEYENLKAPPAAGIEKASLLNRKFCSFVVSNSRGADPVRDRFFKELSKYKKVDSGGRHLNNIGGAVQDKLSFCAKYKFNIAIENSSSPGYVTEKVMQPLSVNSVPIYYGDPLVSNDFNPGCMVRIGGADDIDRAIAEIIELDRNDEAYLEKCLAPRLAKPWDFYLRKREAFISHIIEQPLQSARRTVDYGYQHAFRRKLRSLYSMDDLLKKPVRLLREFIKGR